MRTVCFDVETTGLQIYRGDRIFAYAVCGEEGEAAPTRLDFKDADLRRKANHLLQEIISDSPARLTMHNAIFDIGACRQSGFEFPDGRPIADTFVMSHILKNNARSHALDELAWELGGYPKDLDKRVQEIARKVGGYKYVPEHIMNEYQASDVIRGMALNLLFWDMIKNNPYHLDNYNTEIDMIWVSLWMMEKGVKIHKQEVIKLLEWLRDEITQCVIDLEAMAGKYINPDSPDQLVKLLYDELHLPVIKETKTGRPSTEKEVLFDLYEQTEHPILRAISKYRSYSGAIKALKKYLVYADRDGVIHANIRPCAAVTGRQAISEPPLMGVSKDTSRLNPFPVPARNCFGPRPGMVWFCIDYKGIQALLLAGRSGDEEAIKIFNSGGSMHEEAAKIFYGNRYKMEKDKTRKETLYGSAKNANFAKPFGASMPKMLRTLGLQKSQANRVKAYENRFPKYCGINRVLMQEVLEQGFIETTHGRRLHIIKKDAYMGANYYAQGEEACIMKRAEIRVDNFLQDATSGEAQLIMPVHDEIVMEYPRSRLRESNEILREVRNLMTDFPEIKVPLEVDVSVVTYAWNKKEEVNLDD